MSCDSREQLEMELRVLGRRLGERPGAPVLAATRQAAAEAVAARALLAGRRARRRLAIGLPLLLTATLPVPLLFLWADWTAVSSLLGMLLPESASHAASVVYLWIKVCALCVIYTMAGGGLAWGAARMSRGWDFPEAEAVSA